MLQKINYNVVTIETTLALNYISLENVNYGHNVDSEKQA